MRKNKEKLFYILLSISIIMFTVPDGLGENYVIIHFGIKVYHAIQAVAGAAMIVILCTLLVLLICIFKENKVLTQEEQKTPQQQKPYENGVFNNAVLQNILKQREKSWPGVSREIEKMVAQLKKMDDLQERLHTLLQDNDADVLSDTEDILGQVEQYICKNIYSCANLMYVYDPNAETDIEAMRKTLLSSIEKNGKELHNAQDFMLALAEYINKQNGLGQDTSALETYKNIILKSIGE